MLPDAVTSIFYGNDRSQHDRLERKREVLLDGGVKSHGLLGFVVRVDDGFLDHSVEAARRDRGGAQSSSMPCVSVAVTRHASSRQRSAAPARQCAAPKCSEAPGLQSLFQAYRSASSVEAGKGGRQAPRLSPRVGYAKYGMVGTKNTGAPPLKPVVWLGDSVQELRTFPAAVQDEMGYAIYLARVATNTCRPSR